MRLPPASLAIVFALVACDGPVEADRPSEDAGPDTVGVCYFESGRPCPADRVCLAPPGHECSYLTCDPETGHILGAPVACERGPVEPVPGGPFNCDPATIEIVPSSGGITPPPAPCPLGSLWSLYNEPGSGGTYGRWGQCVPVSQCLPLPCDPQFNGDGCPIDWVCDAQTHTCVAS